MVGFISLGSPVGSDSLDITPVNLDVSSDIRLEVNSVPVAHVASLVVVVGLVVVLSVVGVSSREARHVDRSRSTTSIS